MICDVWLYLQFEGIGALQNNETTATCVMSYCKNVRFEYFVELCDLWLLCKRNRRWSILQTIAKKETESNNVV